MRVVTLKDIPDLPVEGAAEQTAGWTGSVARSRQTIIPPGESDNYNTLEICATSRATINGPVNRLQDGLWHTKTRHCE